MEEIEKIDVNNITMDSIFSTLVEIQNVNPAALAISKRHFNDAKNYYVKAVKGFNPNRKYEFVNNDDILLANKIYNQIKNYNVENLVIVFEMLGLLLKEDIKKELK